VQNQGVTFFSETYNEDNTNSWGGESDALKYVYWDETWSQEYFTYDPKFVQFIGWRDTS
jgi:hypothetical protein